jgi:hypothetical protein
MLAIALRQMHEDSVQRFQRNVPCTAGSNPTTTRVIASNKFERNISPGSVDSIDAKVAVAVLSIAIQKHLQARMKGSRTNTVAVRLQRCYACRARTRRS